MPEDELDRFLVNHKNIVAIIDANGLRGLCTKSAEFSTRVGVGDDELVYHSTLFGIDGYAAEAAGGTYCGREAVRKMEEVLGTALI